MYFTVHRTSSPLFVKPFIRHCIAIFHRISPFKECNGHVIDRVALQNNRHIDRGHPASSTCPTISYTWVAGCTIAETRSPPGLRAPGAPWSLIMPSYPGISSPASTGLSTGRPNRVDRHPRGAHLCQIPPRPPSPCSLSGSMASNTPASTATE